LLGAGVRSVPHDVLPGGEDYRKSPVGAGVAELLWSPRPDSIATWSVRGTARLSNDVRSGAGSTVSTVASRSQSRSSLPKRLGNSRPGLRNPPSRCVMREGVRGWVGWGPPRFLFQERENFAQGDCP